MDITSININLFICFSVPILFAALVLKGRIRIALLFLFFGLETCLFCGELNNFVLNITHIDIDLFSILISLVIEEIFLAAPLLIYIFIWKPNRLNILELAILLGVGFAIQENAYILIKYSESTNLSDTIMRAFGAGLTHVLTSIFLGLILSFIVEHKKHVILYTILTVFTCILYHALFNFIAISFFSIIGFFLPIVTSIPLIILIKKDKKKNNLKKE